MEDVGSLDELISRADVIVSVCPPDAAVDVAEAVSNAGFDGIYVDANAIAPATARSIGARFTNFVDGGIVGPPARAAGTTRLYLSGDLANDVAALWKDTLLETRIVDGGAGAASAVKVCFAAWTKGTAALLLAIRALAVAENVEDALIAEWATSQPGLDDQSMRAATGNAPKAWRFAGELDEIAKAFAGDDLPGGFATAAADIYQRLAQFKDVSGTTLQEVINALRLPADGRPPTAPA
jgi:3-hydroxyisobutyrate dehydrogenase-like beta-hydroxyacid dehydrogenase